MYYVLHNTIFYTYLLKKVLNDTYVNEYRKQCAQMRKGRLSCILSPCNKNPSTLQKFSTGLSSQNCSWLRAPHPLLTRLVRPTTGIPLRVECCPPRKYFTITKEGKAFFKELNTSWTDLSNAVNTLIKKKT